VTIAAPVAVTGAAGRLGRAMIAELDRRGIASLGWTRPDYDLDDGDCAARLIARDRPRTVIHCAAWTDVDGCARDPDLAHRRNALAVESLASACAAGGIELVLISTNEVFDGARSDGAGYTETDELNPINAYGASKLAGEQAALRAYEPAAAGDLFIVRTAWLYGPPGNDFPTKILAAAQRLAPGAALRVVTDEIGSPTFTPDLARAVIELADVAPAGVYHLAASGSASRFELAQEVLEQCLPGTPMQEISASEFVRASAPPPWAVLDCTRAAGFGVVIRPWQDALREYLSGVC
jgi:dTDP-4-dehydrorhamnose reductase